MIKRERNLYIFNFIVFTSVLLFLLLKLIFILNETLYQIKISVLFFIIAIIACILRIYQQYIEIKNKKNEIFKDVFFNANDAMAIIDREGTYIWQNKTNLELLGYSIESLNTLDTIFYVNKVKVDIKKELDKLEKISGIYSLVDSNLRPKEMWVSAFTIKDELGDVICYVEIKKDINEFIKVYKQVKEEKSKYEKQAYFDFLTNVLNRNGFYHHINNIKIATGSIIFADIDKFKYINDNFGHDLGDIVLKEVANVLKTNAYKDSIIARWGGEEFIIFINTSKVEAIEFTESLRKKIETLSPQNINVTCSFGVSEVKEDIDLSIINADKALYYSKNNGRNRVTSFSEDGEYESL